MSQQPKQTIIAYLGAQLSTLTELQAYQFSESAVDSSGEYIPIPEYNYIPSVTSVKEGIHVLDEKLYSVATTYATLSYTNQQISTVIGGSSTILDTLQEISESLGNDANFAANFVSSISGMALTTQNNETEIQTNLTAQSNNAAQNESTIQSNLDTQISSAQLAETVITSTLGAEVERSSTIRTTLLTSITDEIVTRTEAVTNLGYTFISTFDDLSGNIRLALQTEISRSGDAQSTLKLGIDIKMLSSMTEDSSFTQALDDEIQRATASISTLTSTLNAEILRATASENLFSTSTSVIEDAYINKDGSVVMFGTLDMSGSLISNVIYPTENKDIATKEFLTDKIASLGDAFEYVDTIQSGTDLRTLSKKAVGDVYKVIGTGGLIYNTSVSEGSLLSGEIVNQEQGNSYAFIRLNYDPTYSTIQYVYNGSYLTSVTNSQIITPGTFENPLDMREGGGIEFKELNICSVDGWVLVNYGPGEVDPYTKNTTGIKIQVSQNDILRLIKIEYPDETPSYYVMIEFIAEKQGEPLTLGATQEEGNSITIFPTPTVNNVNVSKKWQYREVTPGYGFWTPYQYNFMKYIPPNVSPLIYAQDNYNIYAEQFNIKNTISLTGTTVDAPYDFTSKSVLDTLKSQGFTGYDTIITFTTNGYIKYTQNNGIYPFDQLNQIVGTTIQILAGDSIRIIYDEYPSDSIAFIYMAYYKSQAFTPSLTVDADPIALAFTGEVQPGNYTLTQSTGGFFIFSRSVLNTGDSQTTYYTFFARDGDFIVSKNSNGQEWDRLNNSDYILSADPSRITVSGNGFDGYTLDISPSYTGQETITTVGTIATGEWNASVIGTEVGGTSFNTYSTGDLLVGNDTNSLTKLTVGADGTFLKSSGTDLSWVPMNSQNHSLSSTTNFPELSTLQQSLDYIFDKYQKRNIVQFVVQNSSAYSDPLLHNSNLLSGKINFINYVEGSTTIYLPSSATTLADGTIVRLVHNGDDSSENLLVKYRVGEEEQSIIEIAPHDTTAFVWNQESSSWVVGIGI